MMRKLDKIAGDIIECCVPKEQITEDVKRRFGVMLREFRETLIDMTRISLNKVQVILWQPEGRYFEMGDYVMMEIG